MYKTLLIILLLFVSPAFADSHESAYERVMRTGTLRCGYSEWAPYFSVDPNTKVLSGFAKDLSDDIAKILELKIEYVVTPLGQHTQDLNSGKIDAVCGDGPLVLSTIKYVDYTKPYFYVPFYAYGRANETRFTTPESMNKSDITFTVMDGDTSTDIATNYFPKAKLNSLGNLTDPAQMLLNVITKKSDVVIDDPVSVALFTKSNPGKIKPLFSKPMTVIGGGFAVKKGETDLFNTLNGATDALINTGQAERTLKKYDPDGTLFLPVATPYQNNTKR